MAKDKSISVFVDESFLLRVDEACAKAGVDRSKAMRQALLEWVQRVEAGIVGTPFDADVIFSRVGKEGERNSLQVKSGSGKSHAISFLSWYWLQSSLRDPEIKVLALRLPDDLHKNLESICEILGTDMATLVREMIDQYLPDYLGRCEKIAEARLKLLREIARFKSATEATQMPGPKPRKSLPRAKPFGESHER